jgi:hypothetical protein
VRRHDIEYNDAQHDGIEYNDAKHEVIYHNHTYRTIHKYYIILIVAHLTVMLKTVRRVSLC